jgi:hypothetical protein
MVYATFLDAGGRLAQRSRLPSHAFGNIPRIQDRIQRSPSYCKDSCDLRAENVMGERVTESEVDLCLCRETAGGSSTYSGPLKSRNMLR